MPSSPYIGRFAPSPSGPLHMGSLLCAVASFMDAKSHQGKWLLRIEDIDPPREQTGASDAIIETLQLHGLLSDEALVYQSQRSSLYKQALEFIDGHNLSYACTCTRKRLSTLAGVYDGHCRINNRSKNEINGDKLPAATRIDLQSALAHLNNYDLSEATLWDQIQGHINNDLTDLGDFIIHRKDGLFAYQLAVVVDDLAQGITHVVRGTDLIDCTHKQNLLLHLLHKSSQVTPQKLNYAHIPVLSLPTGLKLSKQNHAPAIDNYKAKENVLLALTYLHQSPPRELTQQSLHQVIQWGIENWDIKKIPKQKAMCM